MYKIICLHIYCNPDFTKNIIVSVFQDYSSFALQLGVVLALFTPVWVCYAFMAGVFDVFQCGPLRRE